MIDEESERAVTGWLKLGDQVVGRSQDEDRCEQCGAITYVSRDGKRRICARCYLDGASDNK